ncbi:hypothetical protein HU200_037791 [Digitaria exilis]|uniref:Uncharacterized protein n=1 Tax=Digitaria exilis TaxID=1010633 RepID=A0A835BB69_9POAL|nr:hypothetical protein HU200_037791 [Digitaria exilis]
MPLSTLYSAPYKRGLTPPSSPCSLAPSSSSTPLLAHPKPQEEHEEQEVEEEGGGDPSYHQKNHPYLYTITRTSVLCRGIMAPKAAATRWRPPSCSARRTAAASWTWERRAKGEEDVVARTSGSVGSPSWNSPCRPRNASPLSSTTRETAHMPRDDYAERMRGGGLDLRIRMDAIDWIGQVGESRYVFESKTIQRMELLVLSTLKWRMQAVTPLLLHRLLPPPPQRRRCAKPARRPAICRAHHVHSKRDALLRFSGPRRSPRLSPPPLPEKTHAVDIDKACIHRVQKERVSQCLEAIQATMALPASTMPLPPKTETRQQRGQASSSVSVPLKPYRGAGRRLPDCRSDDTVAASHASSWSDENDSSPVVCSKRRKI